MEHAIYRERRQAVLGRMGKGSSLGAAAVFPSAPVRIRNNDVEHEYRQDSDLYFLTGFDEPKSVLVLTTVKGERKTTLFLRERNPEREVWDGKRLGVENAVESLGVDAAFPVAELDKRLPELLFGAARVYHRWGSDRDDAVFRAVAAARAKAKRGGVAPKELVLPDELVHELRIRKSQEELALMRKAAEITGMAHRRAMEVAVPGAFEYEVEAEILRVFRANGSERSAYGSIVGSGPNATVLHYRANNRKMQEGDLLLIDAGCEFGYYASDVTRTFPISGKFTEGQRELYDLVLQAQLASIECVKPGATLENIHDASVAVLAAGMVRLGLIEGPVEDAIREERYKKYYMHRTSHWIGMDVHDVGAYFSDTTARPLEPGFVLTIEPGIYISADADAPDRFKGAGIRIEDDILVTASGYENLTAHIVKSADEIEAFLSARSPESAA